MLTSRLFALTLSCLALAACGGNGSKQGDSKKADEADPRAGYFHETESMKLNPPLKQYGSAWAKYAKNPDACNKEANRLFAAGASPRRAVRCHIQETQALIDAGTALRAAVSELDGDYRTVCETQVRRFGAALDKVNAARQRTRSDWNAYARTGKVPAKIQQHSTAADTLAQIFLDKDVRGLRTACYTAADRA